VPRTPIEPKASGTHGRRWATTQVPLARWTQQAHWQMKKTCLVFLTQQALWQMKKVEVELLHAGMLVVQRAQVQFLPVGVALGPLSPRVTPHHEFYN
jgi:hypothetical protein